MKDHRPRHYRTTDYGSCGLVVPWSCGPVVFLRSYGPAVLWSCGLVVLYSLVCGEVNVMDGDAAAEQVHVGNVVG